MHITKIHIENFKILKDFTLTLNSGLNILVWDNEAGKSTIIEAIHIALTGLYRGRYLKNELSQYLFHSETIEEYLSNPQWWLPHILIEVYLQGEDIARFEWNGNIEKVQECGFSLKIEFDDNYHSEYEQFAQKSDLKTLPIEYYKVTWDTFARESITPRNIPLKSAFIDSSSALLQNGSDMYISRIVKNLLDEKNLIDISQAYRNTKESFMNNPTIQNINKIINHASSISNRSVSISVDLSTKNTWEQSLMTYVDKIPFHNIGKGEQCMIKTKLALEHKKSKEANILLLEEPESHLSHSKLNQLIYDISSKNNEKQIIISTHSSFVANKLGLEHIILLQHTKPMRFDELQKDTSKFFQRLSWYDTLRLILSEKVILVEGDSDELIIQRAFMDTHDGKLPIESAIDVISVAGLSFKRFLEIAEKIDTKVAVVTDTDGKIDYFKKKYENYIGENTKTNIKICFDETIDTGERDKFNYNTLEPKLLKVNNFELFNNIFSTNQENDDEMLRYMHKEKTECALKIFEAEEKIQYPQYILDAIKFCEK